MGDLFTENPSYIEQFLARFLVICFLDYELWHIVFFIIIKKTHLFKETPDPAYAL
jgi:hypothetical protein